MMYPKTTTELNNLIRLGKRTGDMKLRNLAQKALRGLDGDDGTPGLAEGVWKYDVLPYLNAARARAEYVKQTRNAVNVAVVLGNRRRALA